MGKKPTWDTWYAANRERLLEKSRQQNRTLRAEALEAYGQECWCCGEANPAFLSLGGP